MTDNQTSVRDSRTKSLTWEEKTATLNSIFSRSSERPPIRLLNTLMLYDITSVDHLCEIDTRTLLRSPNFSKRSLVYLRRYMMEHYGRTLSDGKMPNGMSG